MRITSSIEEGDFFSNKVLLGAMENCNKNSSSLHCMGLISPGGVHSHTDHLLALVKMAKENGVKKIFVHCFMDGRDVPPKSGKEYIETLEKQLKEIGAGKIATVSGRYYAMDRDNRWDRVEKAYAALVYGEGDMCKNAVEAMEKSYAQDVTDEFVVPSVMTRCSRPIGKISDKDSVVFFNFRPDRAREISRALTEAEFDGFERRIAPKNLYYVTMTRYDEKLTNVHIAFEPEKTPAHMFAEYLAKSSKKQLRIAETEKYAHVTFFFNSGVEEPFEGEDRILIPSPKVATYDLKPSMSAYEVTDAVIEQIKRDYYDVIILNFANCDMVGHTGVMSAAVEAVKTVDECVGRIYELIKERGDVMFITADHGNAEQMADPVTGQPHTAHTTNPVPFIYVNDNEKNVKLRDGGKLADIVPTVLDAMKIEKPVEMKGETLIERN